MPFWSKPVALPPAEATWVCFDPAKEPERSAGEKAVLAMDDAELQALVLESIPTAEFYRRGLALLSAAEKLKLALAELDERGIQVRL